MTFPSQVVVKIKRLTPEAIVPRYEHPGDAGADLVSIVEHTLQPMQRYAVPTGNISRNTDRL